MRTTALLFLLSAFAACSREHHSKPVVKTTTIHAAEEPAAGRTEVGDVMPAYSATYLDGKTLDLAAEKGNVVLLNVWATWCVPCRKEMATLDRLQARLGGKKFQVVALSIDRKGIEAVPPHRITRSAPGPSPRER